MTHRARPQQSVLVKLVSEAREIIKSWKPWHIHFVHIAREHNSWLNFLTNHAFLRQRAVQLQDLVTTTPLTERSPRIIKASMLGNHVQPLCGTAWDDS